MLRNGISPERIRELRSPIGLDIHARTPEEIAVSILGEMLMFRLGGTGQPMQLEEWHLDRIENKLKGTTATAAD